MVSGQFSKHTSVPRIKVSNLDYSHEVEEIVRKYNSKDCDSDISLFSTAASDIETMVNVIETVMNDDNLDER